MRTEVAAKKVKPKPTKASEALGKHEGKTLMVTQTDRTKVGGGYLGGPGFSGIQHDDPRYANMAWGVNHPAVASTILGANRRVPEGEAIWSTLIGTPEQHTSNQMVFDKLVHDFNKAAKAGLLSEDLRNKMNERLSVIADKEGKPFFGIGADIRDPELIKSADTFAKRKIIADLIGGHGVGGKKGQIGNYDKLLHSTTDPIVRDVPTHAVGPRLFELSGETSNRPDLHSAFPYLLHGQDLGQTYEPVPKELMLRDYIQRMQAIKGRAPGYMDFTRGHGPTQHLSEEFLSHLQKRGYADGGAVEPDKDTMLAHLMLHKTPDSVNIKDVGVNEAPDLPIKAYVSPNGGSGAGLPIGGVDFQPLTPGNQMMPMQAGQQPGIPSPQSMGTPPMGTPPGAPPQPGQPQSNILSLTRPGQAMQALRPNPQAMPQQPGPNMPKMKKGGGVEVRPTVKDETIQRKIPEMEDAVKALQAGTITRAQYDKVVKQHKPVKPYEFVPQPATDEDAERALKPAQKDKWRGHEQWPAGRKVGLRLDIPAYENHGVWVNSIHDEEGSDEDKYPTAYNSVSSVKNATFDAKPEKAVRVATGEQNKSPFARIKGELHHMTEDEAVEHMKAHLNHPDYVQVGMDPRRHGYFYDRKTMKPITHSAHVVQIGPLVLAHKPTYGKRETYAKGGEVSRETKTEFVKNSKVKDVLYRGGVGYPDMSEDFLKGKARPGYATFASTSPHVAGSYAHPDHDEVGAIAPMHIKAHTVHEFPVTTDKHGSRKFDKFAFDRRAQQLQPGHALVARQVFDYGPRANTKTDPDKLYSYPSDIYAWNNGTEVKSALSKAKGGAIKPIGYTKERVTVSPNLDAMRYEMMSVKRYTKKAK